MGENILETRILLRYATYNQWMNSDVILKLGEAAIASFPNVKTLESLSNSTPNNTPPAIGIKIGDGKHYFSELPWVQAIAADVYQWAKSMYKPIYTANEISGLTDYIQEHAPSGPGDGTVAPRIYQIIRGTGNNENKYYLQYKESSNASDWITDTTHYIDVEDFVKVAEWIGTDVDNFGSLASRTEYHIQYDLGLINYPDTETTDYFVTAVPQTSGFISTVKKPINFTNIKGTLSVEQGGTGVTELEYGKVLIGNGTNAIRTLPIDSTVDENNHLVTNLGIKRYVDNLMSGLEGAMHFIGDASVSPPGTINAGILNYIPAAGDVVLWEAKEYVWTGGSWRLLGDESSYAIKGSIRDADIDTDANIQQSKIYNLTETFAGKVDKEQGKGLSTNDYTTEEKNKLAGIEPGAQVNIIEHILLNETEISPQIINNVSNVVPLVIKEFPDSARDKLATIEEFANVNIIEGIILNEVPIAPDANKLINLTIKEFSDEDKLKLDNIEPNAQVNVIETVYLNGTPVSPDNKRLDLHVLGITPEQAEKLENIEPFAQVNKVESIIINGNQYNPDQDKSINITLNTIDGANYQSGINEYTDINVINRKLRLSKVAATGNIDDLIQTLDTYVIFNCGSSTEVM